MCGASVRRIPVVSILTLVVALGTLTGAAQPSGHATVSADLGIEHCLTRVFPASGMLRLR